MRYWLVGSVMGLALAANAKADLSKGIELYNKASYAEAVAELQNVTSQEPGNVEALSYLGLALVKSGRPNDAEQPLRRAIEINGEHANAHYGLGLVLGYQKKLAESIQELERAVALDPNHAYARYNLGLAHNQQGKVDLAILHLQRFLELAPQSPEAPQVQALLKQIRK